MHTPKVNSNSADHVLGASSAKGMQEVVPEGANRKGEMEIWEDFRKGNESAFILMYKLYFDALVYYGSQFTVDEEIIKDAIQDLYIDLRRKRSELPSLHYSLKFYLFRALKNNILQYIRRNRTAERHYFLFASEQQAQDVSHEYKIVEMQEQEHLKKRLRVAQERLTRRQKEALFYLYYENFSYREIQKLMRLRSIKSARNLVYGAINALRNNI